MPPTIILIRHAEGEHNATEDWTIRDPKLTALGHQQCKDLSSHLQKNLEIANKVELIVTSPLKRTLQTTDLSLDWLIKRGVPVQVRGEWQENSNMPCDTGTSVDELSKEFPQFKFDKVFSDFPSKSGRWAFSEKAIVQRGIDCRDWLRSRPESVIAVVTHSAFLRLAIQPSRYANADFRVYDFQQDSNILQQWPLTKDKGGGMGKSPKGEPVVLSSEYGIPDQEGDVNNQDKDLGEATEQKPA